MSSIPDIEEDIAVLTFGLRSALLSGFMINLAALTFALERPGLIALGVFDATLAAVTVLLAVLRRQARRRAARMREDAAHCAVHREIQERLARLQRVIDGLEKGLVPAKDWEILSGGKPLPVRAGTKNKPKVV